MKAPPVDDKLKTSLPVGAAGDPATLASHGSCCSDVAKSTLLDVPQPFPSIANAPGAHATDDDCCSAKGGEIAALAAHADIRRVLLIVLGINSVMFVAELTAGVLARSTSLI